MASAKSITSGISIICGIIATILLVGYVIPSNNERLESAQRDLDEIINKQDQLINKAIVHCETDGLGCDVIMPQWLEECKRPENDNIPSCHDGRIEHLIKNPVIMSEECRELKEIIEQIRWRAERNDLEAIMDLPFVGDEYRELGCP